MTGTGLRVEQGRYYSLSGSTPTHFYFVTICEISLEPLEISGTTSGIKLN